MNVYIPAHLKKLEIIKNMDLIIKEYAKSYSQTQGNTNSYSSKNDPVQKFLSLCITEDMIDTKTQTLETIIQYVTKLFYSVKGTIKVFEYMKKYLHLEIRDDIFYNTEYIELHISSISLTDEGNFSKSLEEFLSALLYFKELRLEMDGVDITIQGNISNKVGSGISSYRVFNITNQEIIEL